MQRLRFAPAAVLLAAVLLAALLPASPVLAQDDDIDVDAVQARAARELSCLERIARELERDTELLRDARAQMRAARGDAAARRDAARAVEAIERKVSDLLKEAGECIEDGAGGSQGTAERTEDGRRVVYVDPPPDPTAEAVAQRNPATDVVQKDEKLSANVTVARGERVDGQGEVDDAEVKRAVSRIAPRLERCYGVLVDRGALERGTGILVFTVTPRGRVAQVHTEQVRIGGPGFARCIRHAGRRLRFRGGADGGKATYSYTLRFGD